MGRTVVRAPLEKQASRLKTDSDASLVVIGNFDGVHRGHQMILAEAVSEAESRELSPSVLTFEPHPSVVLGQSGYHALTSPARKLELLRRVSRKLSITVEPFTPALAAKSPAEFARELLIQRLHSKVVVVGPNFRFGRGRAGDLSTLEELGKVYGFEAKTFELLGDAAGAFSSTRARQALGVRDLEGVRAVLGRPHSFSGVVAKGDGRGKRLGFPTANLVQIAEALPPNGVYACAVDIEQDGVFQKLGVGLANLGVRPTFEAGASVELYLLDYEGDLYERQLRLHLVGFLRDERRFGGVDELKRQLELDVAQGRSILTGIEADSAAAPAWF